VVVGKAAVMGSEDVRRGRRRHRAVVEDVVFSVGSSRIASGMSPALDMPGNEGK
jgi:hypothetical protein